MAAGLAAVRQELRRISGGRGQRPCRAANCPGFDILLGVVPDRRLEPTVVGILPHRRQPDGHRRRPLGWGRPGQPARTFVARGPLGLDSTRTRPSRRRRGGRSRATRRAPLRWKKYSLVSSAAMKPNPRSETTFLIVPVDMSPSCFPERGRRRTVRSRRRSTTRSSPRTAAPTHGQHPANSPPSRAAPCSTRSPSPLPEPAPRSSHGTQRRVGRSDCRAG